jgi:hypothetical protein
MELDAEYPKHHSHLLPKLRHLLSLDTKLPAREREELALALNEMGDLARDLVDIIDRLTGEPHSSKEVAELLIAFELTMSPVRGNSDAFDGRLFESADRIKEAAKRRRPAVTANGKRKRATASG